MKNLNKIIIVLLAAFVFCGSLALLGPAGVSGTEGSTGTDMKYLGDITPEQNGNLFYYVNSADGGNTQICLNGKTYEKGICTHPGDGGPSELTYDISGLGYNVFCATGGKDVSAGAFVGNDQILNTLVQLQVYVDGVLQADSGALAYPNTYEFRVNITGAKELKLVSSHGGDGIFCDSTSWAEARLIKADVSAIEIANQPRTGYMRGDALDCTGAKLKVRYSDGAEVLVALTADMISGYKPLAAGKQTVTVSFGGQKTSLELFVADASKDMTELTPVFWEVFGGSSEMENPGNQLGINRDFSGGTGLCIADVSYAKGFGVHPVDNGSPAVITFDVENCGYQYFYAAAGKDRSAGNEIGVDALRGQYGVSFDILADGEKVASSPVLYYGEAYHFLIDITGVRTLTLRVHDEDSIFCDSSSWCSPVLLNVPEQTVEPGPQTGDTDSSIAILAFLLILALSVKTVSGRRCHKLSSLSFHKNIMKGL